MDLTRSGVCAENGYRNPPGAWFLLQGAQYFFASQVRQMQIQQNPMGQVRVRELQAQFTPHGFKQLHGGIARQDLLNETNVRDIVFDVEDRPLIGSSLA